VAGFCVQQPTAGSPLPAPDAQRTAHGAQPPLSPADDAVLCLCERVRRSDVVASIRAGVRDLNQLKAAIRCTLGGCNGKRCTDPILQVFRQEGIDPRTVTRGTYRPLDLEVPLGVFAGACDEPEGGKGSGR
jgi:bacterioferritin-associated ferredoxin